VFSKLVCEGQDEAFSIAILKVASLSSNVTVPDRATKDHGSGRTVTSVMSVALHNVDLEVI
jgi:hypothetical protein